MVGWSGERCCSCCCGCCYCLDGAAELVTPQQQQQQEHHSCCKTHGYSWGMALRLPTPYLSRQGLKLDTAPKRLCVVD